MSFSCQGEEEVTSVQTRKKRLPPPPDDVEYWMTKLEWPRGFLDAEKPANFGPVDLDGTIGSVDDIREDLREHAGGFVRPANVFYAHGLLGLMTVHGRQFMTSFTFKLPY